MKYITPVILFMICSFANAVTFHDFDGNVGSKKPYLLETLKQTKDNNGKSIPFSIAVKKDTIIEVSWGYELRLNTETFNKEHIEEEGHDVNYYIYRIKKDSTLYIYVHEKTKGANPKDQFFQIKIYHDYDYDDCKAPNESDYDLKKLEEAREQLHSMAAYAKKAQNKRAENRDFELFKKKAIFDRNQKKENC